MVRARWKPTRTISRATPQNSRNRQTQPHSATCPLHRPRSSMPLDSLTAANFVRAAQGLQEVYAFWRSDGDVKRAQLAMDAANWYYQQLGLPFYYPGDFPGYVPSPTSPAAYDAIANSLPLPAALGGGSAGGSGSGYGSTSQQLQAKAIARLSSAYVPQGALGEYCSMFSDDPICYGGDGFYQGGLDNGGGGNTVYIDQPVTVIINQQGLTLQDVASRISSALASAIQAVVKVVDAAMVAAIAGIQHALNTLGNELLSVFQKLSRLAGYVLSFLKGLLLDVVHGLVRALRALATVLKDVRRILAILRVFHIRFASKLDAVLADIQAKISAPLLYLLKWTNTVANYINLILDARLLIQKPLWLATFKQHAGSSVTLQLNSMTGRPDPATLAALQATPAPATPAQSTASLNQFLADGSGDYAALVKQQQTQLDMYLTQGVR